MADTKISALTQLAETPAATDEIEVVDKSDTTDAASGTNKRIQAQHLLPFGVPRQIYRGGAGITTAASNGIHYAMVTSAANQVIVTAGNQLLAVFSAAWFNLTGSDYALTGYTTKLNLRAYVVTGTTAPAVTYTFGLNPVSVVSNAFVLGTLLASVAIASPAANSITASTTSSPTFPADGPYIIRCTPNGTPAGNVSVGVEVLVNHIAA